MNSSLRLLCVFSAASAVDLGFLCVHCALCGELVVAPATVVASVVEGLAQLRHITQGSAKARRAPRLHEHWEGRQDRRREQSAAAAKSM